MKITRKMALRAGIPAAAVLVIGVGGGIAVAATSTAAPSNLYGCVSGSTRTLEHVYTDAGNFKTCPKGSFPVTVAKGATGAPGAPGLSNVQAEEPYGNDILSNSSIIQSDSTITAGATGVVWAACPSGYAALGGGFDIGSAADAEGYSGAPGNDAIPGVEEVASEPAYEVGGVLVDGSTASTTFYPDGNYLPNAWAITVTNTTTGSINPRVAVVCADVAS